MEIIEEIKKDKIIELDNKDLGKFQNLKDNIGGYNGKIIKNGNKIIKIAYPLGELPLSNYNIYSELTPNIYYPERFIAYNNKIIGYTREFVIGDRLDDITEISYESFLIALKKLYNDIKTVSDNKIHIFDIKPDNLIYDEDSQSLSCIDTDLWYKEDNKNLYNENIRQINSAIINTLPIFNSEQIQHFIDDLGYLEINENNNLIEYLEELRKEIYEYTNYLIESLTDINIGLIR